MAQKTVLITGALTGIGRATALAFAGQKVNLVVSGRRDEAGAALVAELRALGAQAEYIRADVRHEDDVRALIDGTVARFGRLDVAINNAGTEGNNGPLTDTTVENYRDTFDTNVLGVILSLKHELRVMLPQHSGTIVNVASVLGHKGLANVGVYVGSKHAVEGLTKTAALEAVSAGVRVNAVAPGAVETDMINRLTKTEAGKAGLLSRIPAGRAGRPEEIAASILFLASDDAPFMTGHILTVDGGTSA